MKHPVLLLLPALLLLGLLPGCASPPETVGGIELCRDGRCGPLTDAYARKGFLKDMYRLWKRSEGTKIEICDAAPDRKGCKEEGISFFVQGGPIPGVASIERGLLGDVILDNEGSRIRSKLKYDANFIGVPTTCGQSEVTLTVVPPAEVKINSDNFYCNWLAVGNVLWDGNFLIDYVDFDRRVIGGNYSVGGAGFLAAGGGSGEFLFKFAGQPVRLADTGDTAREEETGGRKATPTPPVPAPARTRPASAPALEPTPGFPADSLAIAYARRQTRPDDIAVIIGNADYGKQGRDIPNVVPAYADAEGIKRYVTRALGIREGNIIDLRDATSAQLVQVFGSERRHKGKLFDWVRPGISRVFVYYSGHGAPAGEDGGAYIIPADAEAQRVELSGYRLSTLYANLAKVPAKSITLVLEACFSGAAQGGAVISNASPVFMKSKAPEVPPNVTVISAGGANQMASWEKDKSHGLFTKYFLKGMSGEADAKPHGNGDGKVEYDELERYFQHTLTYYARRYYGRDQTAVIVVGKGG